MILCYAFTTKTEKKAKGLGIKEPPRESDTMDVIANKRLFTSNAQVKKEPNRTNIETGKKVIGKLKPQGAIPSKLLFFQAKNSGEWKRPHW